MTPWPVEIFGGPFPTAVVAFRSSGCFRFARLENSGRAGTISISCPSRLLWWLYGLTKTFLDDDPADASLRAERWSIACRIGVCFDRVG